MKREIRPDEIGAYLATGIEAIALGPELFPAEAIAQGKYDEIARRAKHALAAATEPKEAAA